MGLNHVVNCPNGVPAWETVSQRLAEHGTPARVRMIDGQPAFPDEAPPADWRELRVALGGVMITIRRAEAGVELVTWGNADLATIAARDALAEAFNMSGL